MHLETLFQFSISEGTCWLIKFVCDESHDTSGMSHVSHDTSGMSHMSHDTSDMYRVSHYTSGMTHVSHYKSGMCRKLFLACYMMS